MGLVAEAICAIVRTIFEVIFGRIALFVGFIYTASTGRYAGT